MSDAPRLDRADLHVVGLDLSLTSTGVASLGTAEALRYKGRGHARLAWLRSEVAQRVRDAELVVIEGAAYGHGAQAGHHELAGLWWLVVHDLWRRSIPYAVASPHQRTIYATGRANPAKDYPAKDRARTAKGMVRTAVQERYGVTCDGPGRYDQADALILAAMGMDWLGYPWTPVPETHRRALHNINWPQPLPARAHIGPRREGSLIVIDRTEGHLPGCAAENYPEPGVCFCTERQAFAREHGLAQDEADLAMEEQVRDGRRRQ